MALYQKHMHQVATYWAPLGPDGFGGVLLDAPVTIACRWQEKAVLFRDSDGREVMSTAVIYPAVIVLERGYVALGNHVYDDDPKILENAYEIRSVQQSPSLNAQQTLYKAML